MKCDAVSAGMSKARQVGRGEGVHVPEAIFPADS
jgi:hypothetical protein